MLGVHYIFNHELIQRDEPSHPSLCLPRWLISLAAVSSTSHRDLPSFLWHPSSHASDVVCPPLHNHTWARWLLEVSFQLQLYMFVSYENQVEEFSNNGFLNMIVTPQICSVTVNESKYESIDPYAFDVDNRYTHKMSVSFLSY